jgi:FSR family fosmidomycin resistance protein-like MFS transporter
MANDDECAKEYNSSQVLAIAGGHFTHDTYSAFVAPLLPLIIERLSLSLMLAGSLTFFLQLPSLLNPVIGYLDDRFNLRRLMSLAPGITATLMSCVGLVSSYWSLALLFLVTGCSMAVFHAPAPAMVARAAGDRVGKGMSFFMAAGEMGRTVGPIFAVWAVSIWTLDGIWRIALIGWVASALLYSRIGKIAPGERSTVPLSAMFSIARRLFLPLVFILFARGFLISSMALYLPTFLRGEGASLWFAAIALSIYELAGVVGALSGGTLSDRLGRKPVLFVALLSSSLLMFLFIHTSGFFQIPVLIALGMVSLSAQPVMLAIIQDNLSSHRSLGSGVHLGLSFVMRPLAAMIIGAMGDWVGLRDAIGWSALIVLAAVPVVILLPNPKK